ncbi:hypothetical protein [Nocardioides sp. LHG3406-4]|uniref:hypothetical protein n=1 Tax=Nocardioides sp. LHG3406-4 TaxID=2804575 RepID=UPI003CFB7E87
MSSLRIRSTLRRTVLAVAALVALVLVPAQPAATHPFGDPQTLAISRKDDTTVRLQWSAAADDLTSLALRLDLLESPRTYVYKDGALVPEESDESDAEALAASTEFGAYLLERMAVEQGGTACAGQVAPVEDLAAEGAAVDFACPEPVSEVDIRTQMLLDVDPAYRTLATGPGGATHVYSAQSESHSFQLVGEPAGADASERGALTLFAWAGGGAAALVAVVLVLRRRRPAP